MKYLVVSDIHGSYRGMSLLLKAIEYEKPDLILLLGDILNGSASDGRNFVADELRKRATYIFAVRGNCDFSEDEYELGFPLPESRCMRIFGYEAHLTHAPYAFGFGLKTMLLNGHTHCKNLYVDNGSIRMNPGSISKPRDGVPSYGIIEEGKASLKDATTLEVITSLSL